MIIIEGHGHINQAGNHTVTFDNLEYQSETKDLFLILSSIFNQPISVLLSSCYGERAVKDVDLLPPKSSLLILAQDDKKVDGHEFLKMFLKFEYDNKNKHSNFEFKTEDYQRYPEKFSLTYFLQSYLFKTRIF